MRVLGLMIHGDVLDLSDAEHGSGMRPSASIRPLKKASHALCERLSVPVLVESPLRLTSSRADVGEECYLVDPASSHMLVLSSLDDLDRALAAAADTKGTEGASALVEGVSLIQKQLRTMLENKYNLVGFGEKGDAYDHDKYEAIASNPAAVKEPVCAEIYLKGYMLKDRVLRPAKVMVHMPDGSVTE